MNAKSWHEPPHAFGSPRENGRKHAGVDLYAPFKTPIYAIADGEVIRHPYAFYDGTNALEVWHPGIGVIRYGEISSSKAVALSEGEAVKEGEIIAYVGLLDSLHLSMLHFELYAESAKGEQLTTQDMPYKRHPALLDPTALIDTLYFETFKCKP